MGAAGATVAAAFVAASLFPFQFDLPRQVRNGATRDGDQVVFRATGIMVEPGNVDLRLGRELTHGEFVVDVGVEADPDQHGPARILSLSSGVWAQSLMLGQVDSSLEVRVRRPGADELGRPAVVVAKALAPGRTHRIRVAVDPDQVAVEVDGTVRWREEVGETLSTWDARHRLVLGNEHGGRRPWRGRVRWATVTTTNERFDLLTTGVLPADLWLVPNQLAGPSRHLWELTPTQVLHAGTMGALGALLALWAPRRPAGRLAFWVGGLAGVTLVLKFAMAGRHPNLADLFVDLTAGTLGILAVRHRQEQKTQQRTPTRTTPP